MLEKEWKKEFEEEILKEWLAAWPYKFDPDAKGNLYSIDTPPPYADAPLHMGAVTYVMMDMFARFHRSLGENVLFPLGLDRNGLPIEIAAEKKYNISPFDVPREKFLSVCEQMLKEFSAECIDVFKRLGITFNSWEFGPKVGDAYLTDSPEYRALTQTTFIDLWNKGLIYEAAYPTNYCPGCRATLADAEVDYAQLETDFVDIEFKVKETGGAVVISTTRPELLCTCAAVIFHPTDERYKMLDGMHAIVPIYEHEVKIFAHPMADPTKGTGIVMMCSFGDLSDIRFFREKNLEPVYAINPDGTMNERAGLLKGLKVDDARKKIVILLEKKNLIKKKRKILHWVPVCERSGHNIEFIALPEFYLKQVKFKTKMRALTRKLRFFPPESKKLLLDWIDSVSIDWPISKRRVYATEVPLWYCERCGEVIVPPKGRYYQPWREPPPIDKCPKCNGTKFRGETRVFDTWFDSAITPLYIQKWGQSFFERNPICTLRPQGKEIIRTWLYYTLLKCYLLTGKCIFRDAWINHHILDERGRKMSKSLGNVIDPRDVLKKFGAEPFRLWTVFEGDLTKGDFRCSFERIESSAKTLIKLWNIARYVSQFPQRKNKVKFTLLDKWILNEINGLIRTAKKNYSNYDFHATAIALRHFVWETFASHYIELSKSRAYNSDGKFTKDEQASAHYTLHTVLKKVLCLFAPIIPFITYKIYKDLYGINIHSLPFPRAERKFTIPFTTDELIALNSSVWKLKKKKGISLRAELTEFSVDKKFEPIEADFVATHNIRKLNFV